MVSALKNGLDTNGAPESWHNPSPEILEKIGEWIDSGHPHSCAKRVEALLSHTGLRYDVTTQKLVAHCIEKHDKGIEMLTAMYNHYHFPLNGFSHCVVANQTRLCNEILTESQTLTAEKGYVDAVRLITRHLDSVHFKRIWDSVWAGGFGARNRTLAEAIFRVAAFSASRARLAKDLIETRAGEVFRLAPEEFVFCLVHSPEMRSVRDPVLQKLLSSERAGAAGIILRTSEYAQTVPQCVSEATRLLINNDPDDPAILIGLGLSLETDPQYAIDIIVDKVNKGRFFAYHNSSFEWRIQKSDQKQLFSELASDVIQRDEAWHTTLAGTHHDLITDIGSVIAWLKENSEHKNASRYNAALIAEYLSDPHSATREQIDNLVKAARVLHSKFGSRTEKSICEEMSLTDRGLSNYDELVAIALAKDVAYPSEPIDRQKLLANLRALPVTYGALGGLQLESEIEKGNLPPFAEYYACDVDSEHADFIRARQFRESWEERFSRIAKANIAIPTKKLRTDRHIWAEMSILSQLIDFFEVEYEPTGVPGMATKRPEFLLKSLDGCLVFEVAAIGTKPEDVREGVKVSTGGTTKKTLQNKWREKFGECKGDFTMPVVIAIDSPHAAWDDFDIENSLYGPEQFTFLTHLQSGKTIPQGTGRDVKKAFFESENVECISAVVHVSCRDFGDRYLHGRIYRPLKTPSHPIGTKLWLRLRTALFGESPKELVAEMSRIPGISRQEAKTLVDHGVDDFSFFATGAIEFPEGMSMGEPRFRELQEEAKRLALICRTGEIAYLRSARGVDLASLHAEKIFTVRQLLETELRPAKIEEELWNRMREEAAGLYSPTR
jgi:hypothetical protein